MKMDLMYVCLISRVVIFQKSEPSSSTQQFLCTESWNICYRVALNHRYISIHALCFIAFTGFFKITYGLNQLIAVMQ